MAMGKTGYRKKKCYTVRVSFHVHLLTSVAATTE